MQLCHHEFEEVQERDETLRTTIGGNAARTLARQRKVGDETDCVNRGGAERMRPAVRGKAGIQQQRGFWLRCFLGASWQAALLNAALCGSLHAQLDVPGPIRLAHVGGYIVNSLGKPVANTEVTLVREKRLHSKRELTARAPSISITCQDDSYSGWRGRITRRQPGKSTFEPRLRPICSERSFT